MGRPCQRQPLALDDRHVLLRNLGDGLTPRSANSCAITASLSSPAATDSAPGTFLSSLAGQDKGIA